MRQQTCELKNQWWKNKAAELKELVYAHNSKAFFATMKAVDGPSTLGLTPLRTTDGGLVKDRESIQECWREHFYNLLNREAEFDPTVLGELKQFPIRHKLGDLKNHKGAGPDGIPAEVLNYVCQELTRCLWLHWGCRLRSKYQLISKMH